MYRFQVTIEASYLDDETRNRPSEIAAALIAVAEELKFRDAGLKDQVISAGEYINWDIIDDPEIVKEIS